MGTSVKIFKKASPNGKFYLYMNQREYVQCEGSLEQVHGILFSEDWDACLKGGRVVYVQLVVQFRHGKEEDEVMGVSFKKELIIDRKQVNVKDVKEETKFQSVMIKRLGKGAVPFTLKFPDLAPNSVLICNEDEDIPEKNCMGVTYLVKAHLANNKEDYEGNKDSVISMRIKKSQNVPADKTQKPPIGRMEKEFTFASGKVLLEASLPKEYFYHGEEVPVNFTINNNSNKLIKQIKCSVRQNIVISTVNANYSVKVASMNSENGCPIEPGSNLQHTIPLKPLAQSCIGTSRGLCLDAWIGKNQTDLNLASSSLSTGNDNDQLGVVVTYVVKVKLVFSGMSNDLVLDIPFKLVHPAPNTELMENLKKEKELATEKMSSDVKRRLFMQQDSVLYESFHASQD